MSLDQSLGKILIVDFGSQFTQLIARRVRELGVYSEIITPKDLIKLKKFHNIKGLIFSGGPSTVTANSFQSVPKDIFEKKIDNIKKKLDHSFLNNRSCPQAL